MARPIPTFNEFVGQRRVVAHLTRLIAGAKVLAKPCPSLLLAAPPGTGKTAFAEAVAAEYGSEFRALFAGRDTRARDICAELANLRHSDVFFLDEGHSLTTDAQQVLYVALDKRKVPASVEGRLQRADFLSVAEFTLIIATNEPGRLKQALRSRLTQLDFDPYSIAELKEIASRVGRKEGVEVTPQAARQIAEAAAGVPRSVYRRVEALKLYFPNVSKYTQQHVEELLASEGLDENGLSPLQRQYLLTLADNPRGASALKRITNALGRDTATILEDVEPYLIARRLVEPQAGRGRAITEDGRRLAEELRGGATAPFKLGLKHN